MATVRELDPIVILLRDQQRDEGLNDADFARRLHREYNVLVLPGSFLARDAAGGNPGKNHIRVALVASAAECLEAAQRLQRFAQNG